MRRLFPVSVAGLVAGLLANLALVVASTPARADVEHHGSECHPTTAADVNRIQYSQFGVHNVSTTNNASVTCPASATPPGSVFSAGVVVYDRSSFADVCCTMQLLTSSGNVLAESSKCSVGNSASASQLSFSFSQVKTGYMAMSCSLPAATSSGLSHVASYNVAFFP